MFKKSFALTLVGASITAAMAASGGGQFGHRDRDDQRLIHGTPYLLAEAYRTATPIKHLVVIYDENVSFDHYFGTYPNAANPTGEPAFTARRHTPAVNGLSDALLTNNPNYTNTANGTDAANPFRLDRTQAATADQNHAYTAEEQAYDDGKADLFPKYTGKGTTGGAGAFGTKGQVMGYYDGNTVTALWNYAQHYAMSDNAYTDTYGPSTPGALEAVSGQTGGMSIVTTTYAPFGHALGGDPAPTGTHPNEAYQVAPGAYSYYIEDGQGGFTMINDVDPAGDICSSPTNQVYMVGQNIGDLLNLKNISWGGFMGGFNLGTANADGSTGCARSTFSSTVNETVKDYIPHHNWFQYYQSTANPTHARPSATLAIGHSTELNGSTAEPANHEYGLNDFVSAVKAGDYPAVSYIKMPAYQDSHAGYSDPLDEQVGVVKLINFLQQQPEWSSTAVIITWDDSDGWYDHQFSKVTNSSFDSEADQLNGPGVCGKGRSLPSPNSSGAGVNGRCGPGTRIPFLVISPWTKANYVSHTQISQASIVKFIEDNWLGGERLGDGSFDATAGSIMNMFDFRHLHGRRMLFLDPELGTVTHRPPAGSDDPKYY